MFMFRSLRKYFSPFDLLHEEQLSLLQIFKPLYVLLTAIGLFPSSIEFPNGKRDLIVVFKSTSMNFAYTLLMTVIICVCCGLHIFDISYASEKNSFTENPMTLFNYVIELVFMLIFSLIAYICALKNRRSYIKILNEIAACWADLPNNDSSDGILGELRVQVNCVVLGSLLLMLIVQLVVTFTGSDPMFYRVLIAITFNLVEILEFTLLAFYFVMILMIVTVLKNIEEHFAVIIHMKRVWCVGNQYAGLKSRPSLASLRRLRGVYARALAVKRQVNAAFQAPLLLLLVQAFHNLISTTHIAYHGITFQDTFTGHDVVECCFWLIYELMKFHILGYSSALLELQANKIGGTLYNISAHINEEITQNKSWADINEGIQLHLEIQHFASMMQFQDTEITICGLFPLKTSLLFDVVASAAMYLVILVQFDNGR